MVLVNKIKAKKKIIDYGFAKQKFFNCTSDNNYSRI